MSRRIGCILWGVYFDTPQLKCNAVCRFSNIYNQSMAQFYFIFYERYIDEWLF
jgi:hypothetical protein